MVEFRELEASDVTSYIALRLRSLRDHPDTLGQTPEDFAELPEEKVAEGLKSSDTEPQSFSLGAFVDGELAGIALFQRYPGAKFRHIGFLPVMYVAPEHRQQGMARALLNRLVERVCAMEGVEQINLAASPAAHHLYQSAGFVTYGIEPRGMQLEGQYFDIEWMQLRLC